MDAESNDRTTNMAIIAKTIHIIFLSIIITSIIRGAFVVRKKKEYAASFELASPS